MEFLNIIFSRGFSGHELESAQTRVFVWFLPSFFRSTKSYLWIDLSLPWFVDFFVGILKTKRRVWGSLNLPVEVTLNSMEKKSRVFYQIDVQEFHLYSRRIYERFAIFSSLSRIWNTWSILGPSPTAHIVLLEGGLKEATHDRSSSSDRPPLPHLE